MKKLLPFLLALLISYICPAQAPDALVAYYPFTNGEVNDQIGSGGDGKIFGSPETVDGVIDQALYFDGGNHAITFEGNVNEYIERTQDFSISLYFRSLDSKNRQSLISKRAECDNYRLFDWRSGNKMYAVLSDASSRNAQAKVYANNLDKRWHHYVFVRKGSVAVIFKDGELIDSRETMYPVDLLARTQLTINNSPCKGEDDTQNLKGAIDELKIFNKALSKREVRQLFESNRAALEKVNTKSKKPKMDSRMRTLFGKYEDRSFDQDAKLILTPKSFELHIAQPNEFEGIVKATLTGSYQIKAGVIYFYGKNLILYNEEGSFEEEYTKEPLIGDLYGEVTIDLYAMGNRLKLKK